jgi:flavodoxin
MTVSILTFSLTGNTKHIVKRLANKLIKVLLFNLVKLDKEIESLGPASSL